MRADDRKEWAKRHQERRCARMSQIDSLEPDMRALVHEYGYHVVHSFMIRGITKPRILRHLVETVLDEFSPTRGTFSSQGGGSARGYKSRAEENA
jgi:hypothetical protein